MTGSSSVTQWSSTNSILCEKCQNKRMPQRTVRPFPLSQSPMLRDPPSVLLLGILVLLATLSQALEVADEASLATCLSSNETAACVLTVPSLSWKRDSVSVKGIKTLYSALGMSTIDLGGYGFVALGERGDDQIAVSLSLEGIRLIDSSTDSPSAKDVFVAKNSILSFKDVIMEDFNLESSLILARNASGAFENVVFKNVRVGSAPALLLQDPLWSFINVTFDAVETSSATYGIVFLTATLSGRNNQVTFGGKISFLNVPDEASRNYESDAISILHDTSSTPILIGSSAKMPSRFILRNSDVNLFHSRSKVNAACPVNITIDSLEAASLPIHYQRSIFNLATHDLLNPCAVTHVRVLGQIAHEGFSLRAEATTAVPILPCMKGAHVPPQAYCSSGTWKIHANDFVTYFESPFVTQEGYGRRPKLDVPIEVVGGNVVISSVTVSNTLLYGGLSPMIVSEECINIATILVDVSEVEIQLIISAESGVPAALIMSSCASETTKIKLIGAEIEYGCQAVVIEGDSMAATFSVDASRCNVWWIEPASVIGVFLLTAVIVALLFVVLLKKRDQEVCHHMD